MGADVYFDGFDKSVERIRKRFNLRSQFSDLQKLSKKRYEAYFKALDDEPYEKYYFRDSYNDSSLLWTMGLSWWEDVGKMLNKNGKMSLANLKKFRTMIAETPMTKIPSGEDWGGTDALEYFTEKKERLLKLLDGAIKAKKSPYFSI